MSDKEDTSDDSDRFGWVDMEWNEPDPIRRDAGTLRPVSKSNEHREAFWSEHDKEDYTCPDCGAHSDELKLIDVHHIDGNPSNNDLENLVGLCRRCHRRRHKRRGIQIRLEEMRREADEMGE